jgi:hypothetical protein
VIIVATVAGVEMVATEATPSSAMIVMGMEEKNALDISVKLEMSVGKVLKISYDKPTFFFVGHSR